MITLVLAFHNHQPVGNFGWVIEDAYQRAYRPLMGVLGRHPSIQFAQHYTGILLDWFNAHHPDFTALIGAATSSQRVELLSGGYYEPILAMLPERDRQAQIQMLNECIRSAFGVAPNGMWLAERVWEPSLPATLSQAGLGFTILDDTHFRSAGLREDEITGYFITEDQGQPLAVLPIDRRLRYTIPFEPPEVTIEYLRSLHREGADRVVVFADDGEKFGVWPDTFKTVYEEEWLERFCGLIESNSNWLRTLTPSRAIASVPPAGRIYIPTASYAEMLHWALPSVRAYHDYEEFEQLLKEQGLLEHYGSFVRGGFWRNFLVKYPEVNAMQKKMLRVSDRLNQIVLSKSSDSPDLPQIEEARRHVLAAQCNCPYWHGVFGGIYLANIRAAIYRELVSAEVILDRLEAKKQASVSVIDYDIDGEAEILYEGPILNLYIRPAEGAGIFEFDYKPIRYNFSDLVQRRPEGYHALLKQADVESEASDTRTPDQKQSDARSIHDVVRVKEPGLGKSLVYDPHRRGVLLEHFYEQRPKLKELRQANLNDCGDFATGGWEHRIERHDPTTRIVLKRAGRISGRPVSIEKRLSLDDKRGMIDVDYIVTPLDSKPLKGWIGIELALAMSAGTAPDRYYQIDGVRPGGGSAGLLNSAGEATGSKIELVDEWLGVRLSALFARPITLLRAPIETVSLSEGGFERNYQGSLILAVLSISGIEWRTALSVSVEHIVR